MHLSGLQRRNTGRASLVQVAVTVSSHTAEVEALVELMKGSEATGKQVELEPEKYWTDVKTVTVMFHWLVKVSFKYIN